MQHHSKAKLEGAGAPLSRILPYFPLSSSFPTLLCFLLPSILPPLSSSLPLLSPFLLFYSTLHINLVSPSFQEQNKLRVYIECCKVVYNTSPFLEYVRSLYSSYLARRLYSDGLFFYPQFQTSFSNHFFLVPYAIFNSFFHSSSQPQLPLPTPYFLPPRVEDTYSHLFHFTFSHPSPYLKRLSLPSYSRGGE